MKIGIKIIKGIIIGLANILPGLSGGAIALSMGVYEKLIYFVNNIFKSPTKCIKEMWTYILGIVIGIILAIFAITYLFEMAPVQTSVLFIGLILGSLPTMISKVEKSPLQIRDVIVFALFAGIILFLPTLGVGIQREIQTSVGGIITLFFLGIIAAATIIIPGISGSMILMALGYYTSLVTTVSVIMKLIVVFKIMDALTLTITVLPFVIGIVFGIFIMARLIEKMLSKYNKTVYWGIIGLIVASPFPIIIELDLSVLTASSAAVTVVLLALGIYLTRLMSKGEEKGEN